MSKIKQNINNNTTDRFRYNMYYVIAVDDTNELISS